MLLLLLLLLLWSVLLFMVLRRVGVGEGILKVVGSSVSPPRYMMPLRVDAVVSTTWPPLPPFLFPRKVWVAALLNEDQKPLDCLLSGDGNGGGGGGGIMP